MRISRTLLAFPLYAALFCFALLGCQLEDITQAFDMASKHANSINEANQTFTPEQEYYLGRAVAAQILSRYPAVTDKAASAYLNQVGQALALSSDQPFTYAGYHFQLLQSNEVNAFAAPGGLIFVTTGMVNLVSGESELAAVLAHEIAHVQNRDAVNAIQNSRLTSALSALGKDAAGQYGGGLPAGELVGLFTDSVSDVVNTMVVKGYSRSQEYAADAAARIILSRTGYDSRALDAVLRTMESRVSQGSGGFGSTHPSAKDRLDALKSQNATLAAEPESRARRFKDALGKYAKV